MRGREHFPDECLTDGEWENHVFLEAPIGSMLITKVHVFSDSVTQSSAQIPGHRNQLVLQNFGKGDRSGHEKGDTCRNRHDIALQSIDTDAAGIDVGDLLRSTECSRQDHHREHVSRHHQLGK